MNPRIPLVLVAVVVALNAAAADQPVFSGKEEVFVGSLSPKQPTAKKGVVATYMSEKNKTTTTERTAHGTTVKIGGQFSGTVLLADGELGKQIEKQAAIRFSRAKVTGVNTADGIKVSKFEPEPAAEQTIFGTLAKSTQAKGPVVAILNEMNPFGGDAISTNLLAAGDIAKSLTDLAATGARVTLTVQFSADGATVNKITVQK